MQQLVQYLDNHGTRRVGLVDSADATSAIALSSTDSVYALMHRGLFERRSLRDLVEEFCTGETISVIDTANDARLMPAFDHPVTALHSFVWLDGSPPSPVDVPATQQATSRVSGSPPNAVVYTVDTHQHLRVVGRINVTGIDTLVLDAVLNVAVDGAVNDAEQPDFVDVDPAAFETFLRAEDKLRFGDVHIQILR